jgi:hypothetical protein
MAHGGQLVVVGSGSVVVRTAHRINVTAATAFSNRTQKDISPIRPTNRPTGGNVEKFISPLSLSLSLSLFSSIYRSTNRATDRATDRAGIFKRLRPPPNEQSLLYSLSLSFCLSVCREMRRKEGTSSSAV